MTWDELADAIHRMPEDKRNTDVSVLMTEMDEVFPVADYIDDWQTADPGRIEQVDGVLDDGHPFLVVRG
jgi:hypothetical protein